MVNERLSAVRADLTVFQGSVDELGNPTWILEDAAKGKHHQIGNAEASMLAYWHLGTAVDVARNVTESGNCLVSSDDVVRFSSWLKQQELLRFGGGDVASLVRRTAERKKVGLLKWLLEHYLFVRIPLTRPHKWLSRVAPYLEGVFTTTFWRLQGLLLAIAMWQLTKHWEVFKSAVVDTIEPSNTLWFLSAIVVSKAAHELGHAIAATRFGSPVKSMGIALVVMWPMLYTDTSNAWRLAEKKKRLIIVAAGVASEGLIALWALLLWFSAPEGGIKNAALYLATTGLAMSLAINASPFMRFDGYFLLSDFLNIPNLHTRASALAKWYLRRLLFGMKESKPEEALPATKARLLAVFALTTWCVRLVIFWGIALLVYTSFTKALGVLLWAVEITWFILLPIFKEANYVFKNRKEWQSKNAALSLSAVLMLLALLFAPLDTGVSGSAWMHAETVQSVFPPAPGIVRKAPENGTPVKTGQVFLRLDSPEFRARQSQAEKYGHALAKQALAASTSAWRKGLERQSVIAAASYREQTQADGIAGELARMEISALEAGVVADVKEGLKAGVWVGTKEPICSVVSGGDVIDVFLPEQARARVAVGAEVTFFVRTDPLRGLKGTVAGIDVAEVDDLPSVAFDKSMGGRIDISKEMNPRDKKGRTQKGIFRVRVKVLDKRVSVQHPLFGYAHVKAKPVSIAEIWGKAMLGAVIRETGF